MQNAKAWLPIIGLALAGGGFFGGIQYQKSQQSSFADRLGQFPTEARPGFNRGGDPSDPRGAGIVTGEVVDVTKDTLTLKLADESTKLILLSSDTPINQTTAGSVEDLTTGVSVVVFGETNDDQTVTAQNIQIDGNIGTSFIGPGN